MPDRLGFDLFAAQIEHGDIKTLLCQHQRKVGICAPDAAVAHRAGDLFGGDADSQRLACTGPHGIRVEQAIKPGQIQLPGIGAAQLQLVDAAFCRRPAQITLNVGYDVFARTLSAITLIAKALPVCVCLFARNAQCHSCSSQERRYLPSLSI
ncbi:hypothetical protein [Novosphingobium sp.]|uniref:hypothetical protein n=1 Tax=Novosphingobium sp. TaxID=1874826 RepID=UPI0025F1C128|nr:hypothetical protein [Novosphingobium sp.]